jgi:hypothetical protein
MMGFADTLKEYSKIIDSEIDKSRSDINPGDDVQEHGFIRAPGQLNSV